ncbi:MULTISPECIES: hypothetical protein [Sphingobacterium]|uniref:hypothetical protein n=1 Tax=Sphingobacterium TaxID=28453 RepID=UPI00247A954C|nr:MULTISPECIES: hypothetical protein [Sphingobacterium]WGQ15565.1 hypothetical protein QG727_03955 [Sphingobacterium faecium]
MAENTDFIDRKIDGMGKFTRWIKENPLAFLCSVLTVLLFVFIYLYVQAKNENISLMRETSVKVENELRNQLPSAVKKEVTKQTAPMKEQVDTTTSQIKQIIREVIK